MFNKTLNIIGKCFCTLIQACPQQTVRAATCMSLLLCHLILPDWSPAYTRSVILLLRSALSQWLCNTLRLLSEFIPLKCSQRRGNSSRKLTIMQSTPHYGAALYRHYLLWDLSGECSPPACLPPSNSCCGRSCFGLQSTCVLPAFQLYVLSCSHFRWETWCNISQCTVSFTVM